MPTQGERQNYLWRPNDNSDTTRLRYDLEAEHWVRSVRSAEAKYEKTSFRDTLSALGLVLNLVLSLSALILILITDIVKYLRRNIEEKQ
ncbi:hypothetical protein [Winogradskyella poriferorum]|uniref:hypothetical protein n=1 Tax=Winogradskyella poriferorum TaxID=307627 RepID=UPI003D647F41